MKGETCDVCGKESGAKCIDIDGKTFCCSNCAKDKEKGKTEKKTECEFC